MTDEHDERCRRRAARVLLASRRTLRLCRNIRLFFVILVCGSRFGLGRSVHRLLLARRFAKFLRVLRRV